MTAIVWVTGASGFVGRHVSRALARRGHAVSGIGISPWECDPADWGVTTWLLAPVAPDSLDALLASAGAPAAIFHLAGGASVGASLADPALDFQLSVGSTSALLDWARTRGVRARVILSSSAAVYGSSHRTPIPVGAVAAPSSPYGHHKRMAELLCESYATSFGIPCSVVRLFSIYGPGLRKQLLWDLCRKLEDSPRRVTLGGTGAEVRDWIHVEAAAQILLDAATSSDRILRRNGGTGRGVDVATIARLVKEAMHSDAEIGFTGERREGDPDYLVADTGCAPDTPIAPTLADGIVEYVGWFRGCAR